MVNPSNSSHLQRICLQFIFDHLGHEDSKIRDAASISLQNITKHLIFLNYLNDLEINQFNWLFHRLNKVILFGNLSSVSIRPNLLSNLSHVFSLLLRQLSMKNSKNRTKGLYQSLTFLFLHYSNPQNYLQHTYYKKMGLFIFIFYFYFYFYFLFLFLFLFFIFYFYFYFLFLFIYLFFLFLFLFYFYFKKFYFIYEYFYFIFISIFNCFLIYDHKKKNFNIHF